MTDKDKLLAAELERRLCWYRDAASEEEFDAEEVDAICVMLQKLSPIEEPRMSREEAYQNIMRRVQEEDGEETEAGESIEEAKDERRSSDAAIEEKERAKGGNRRKRSFGFARRGYRAAVLFVAVFGAAVLSLNMVTYAREDKSLFTMILERVGLLEIVKEETVEEISVDRNDEIESFYDTWADLDGEIKSKIIIPKYIPDGYLLYGIRYFDYNNRKRLLADYYNREDGHLLIEIILWEENGEPYKEKVMDEKIYTLLDEYSDEKILYYKYEDEYICMIFMEKSFYRISGNIELEDIINVQRGLNNIN